MRAFPAREQQGCVEQQETLKKLLGNRKGMDGPSRLARASLAATVGGLALVICGQFYKPADLAHDGMEPYASRGPIADYVSFSGAGLALLGLTGLLCESRRARERLI